MPTPFTRRMAVVRLDQLRLAYAAVRPKGGVLESFGLRGFGAHSSDEEYILVSSIAPRLYLATRMVMDVGSGGLSG